MNSSARSSASAETALPGAAGSGLLMVGGGRPRESPSVDLDALLGEVLDRPRVERDRRRRRLLALELEVGRFLVDGDDVVLAVEDRLDDVVGGLVVHAFV